MRRRFSPQSLPDNLPDMKALIRGINRRFADVALAIPQDYAWNDLRDFARRAPDSTTALQQAVLASEAQAVLLTRANGSVGSVSESIPDVFLAPGAYRIDASVGLGQFSRIRGEGVFLVMIDPTKPHFITRAGASAMCNWIEGIQFIGGSQHIVLTGVNIDTGMTRIRYCTHSASDPAQFAVDLNLRSTHVLIESPRVLTSPKYLKGRDCDALIVRDGWINGYGETNHKPADTASFDVAGVNGQNNKFSLERTILVPEIEDVPTAANTRWIDLGDYVAFSASSTQFGGEDAGFPIIYNNASAGITTTYPYVQNGGISFKDCQLASGNSGRADRGVVVCRKGVPQRVTVGSDCYGLNDGFVINDTVMVQADGATPRTVANYLASITDANHPKIALDIALPTGIGSSVLSSSALAPYLIAQDFSAVGGPAKQTVPSLTATTTLTTPINAAPAAGAAAFAGQMLVSGTDIVYYDSTGARRKLTGTPF